MITKQQVIEYLAKIQEELIIKYIEENELDINSEDYVECEDAEELQNTIYILEELDLQDNEDMREANKENSIKHLIEKIEEQERFLEEMGYDDDFSAICSWLCDQLDKHLRGE